MHKEEERIVRAPLPISLIRRMDELVRRGAGGYQDRTELIREAVEAYVLELAFDKAPELVEPITSFEKNPWAEEMDLMREEPRSRQSQSSSPRDQRLPKGTLQMLSAQDLPGSQSANWREDRMRGHLRFSELRYDRSGRVVENPVGKVRDEPMFGLHNRDYPSLWAAIKMVGLTLDDLVEQEEQRDYLIQHAWAMGEQLTLLDRGGQLKLPALFPTNKEKKPSAEDGFMNFAVGTITIGKDGEIYLSGPLFLWRAAGVEAREVDEKRKLFVGLTSHGYELLDAVAGITPDIPHSPDFANRFFEYLQANAPSDWWGFRTIIEAIGEGIGRADLIEKFHRALMEEVPREEPLDPWTEVQAATNTAGYVARAREWGLLELKQHRGRYLLTEFGREVMSR